MVTTGFGSITNPCFRAVFIFQVPILIVIHLTKLILQHWPRISQQPLRTVPYHKMISKGRTELIRGVSGETLCELSAATARFAVDLQNAVKYIKDKHVFRIRTNAEDKSVLENRML